MIISCSDLKMIRKKHKGKKIVLISGVFDLFHVGHLWSLKRAARFGDILVVNVVNDKRVKVLKGEKRPIVTQFQRALLVDSLRCVDYVVISPKVNSGVSIDVTKKLNPDIFLADNIEKAEKLKLIYPKIKIIPNSKTRTVGTSELIKRILRKYKI